MKAGHLSQYFTAIAAKRLSAVEGNLLKSHQHEFNGIESLKRIFGQAIGKKKFQAKFVYLNDHEDGAITADGSLTWYDARERHLTRSEHRMYFPTTPVSECAAEGDLLVIGRRPDDSVLVVVAKADSTVANQVKWLFGLTDMADKAFEIRENMETAHDQLSFASRIILESIGIEVETAEDAYLEKILEKFGTRFPPTREFSTYARSTLKDVNARENPDAAIMAWMDREETLFRTLERHLLADQLTKGFDGDMDGFIKFSLSVQNRRKSRVGLALENHLETLFTECGVRYARTVTTENKAKPDFLFPGSAEYHDPSFDSVHLTMLGVKSTCKDRWRQVLAEADRISHKHLLTLETAISTNQTDEMKAKLLSLVIPKALHATYMDAQQNWLLDVASFIALVRERQ